jgi:hypothetical protein
MYKIIFVKKIVVLFLLNLFTKNVFAIQNASYYFDINEHTIIEIQFWDYYNFEDIFLERPNELYWNLLIWCKNAQDKLQDVNKSISIFIDKMENKISIINHDENNIDLDKNHFTFLNDDNLRNNIFIILNAFYGINERFDDLEIITVYTVNGDEILKSDNGKIYRNKIFLTRNKAQEYINHNREYIGECFIEEIILNKKNINNIIE